MRARPPSPARCGTPQRQASGTDSFSISAAVEGRTPRHHDERLGGLLDQHADAVREPSRARVAREAQEGRQPLSVDHVVGETAFREGRRPTPAAARRASSRMSRSPRCRIAGRQSPSSRRSRDCVAFANCSPSAFAFATVRFSMSSTSGSCSRNGSDGAAGRAARAQQQHAAAANRVTQVALDVADEGEAVEVLGHDAIAVELHAVDCTGETARFARSVA